MKEPASAFIKSAAIESGFDRVGIAKAEHLHPESERLAEWLSRGFHATMSWMDRTREKREDPSRILDGARSVISLAKNYYHPALHPEDSLKISRYAWGKDYHIVIGKMLDRLVGILQPHFPGKRFISYCDTGPVMDKVWAQRSGIGWIGKHTNVINSESGSWFFLSEIITDLECEFDVPALDHCGMCRECIDACPTGAIVEPYVLDSNKCISFLTIENRTGEIPEPYSGLLDNWVFGCDICQDVCPWNIKFQKPTDEPDFAPNEENLNLNAELFHLMTEDEFSKRFAKSPVKRAKLGGMKRNVDAAAAKKR